ncbi:MAG TPA: hypothetical protein VK607_21085 [Kofleriaceae bacterium]|nr:hypothetical protein [Kofleriaceae bacterium]
MTDRVERFAWMTLASGWLVVFSITAGIANLVRSPRPTRHPGEAAG